MKLDLNDRGPVSGAVRAGEAVSVRAGKSGAAASMLCMPVLGADGAVAGVVQVVGKKDDNNAKTGGWVSRFSRFVLQQRLGSRCGGYIENVVEMLVLELMLTYIHFVQKLLY